MEYFLKVAAAGGYNKYTHVHHNNIIYTTIIFTVIPECTVVYVISPFLFFVFLILWLIFY